MLLLDSLTSESIGLDTKIVSLGRLELKILQPTHLKAAILNFLAAILDFSTMKRSTKLNNAFIGFLDHENIGLDTKIRFLGRLEPEILIAQHFEDGHFEF